MHPWVSETNVVDPRPARRPGRFSPSDDSNRPTNRPRAGARPPTPPKRAAKGRAVSNRCAREGSRTLVHPGVGQSWGNPGFPGGGEDGVEAALARALDRASEAGRFDVVAQLARKLEARRLGRLRNAVPLDPDGRGKRLP